MLLEFFSSYSFAYLQHPGRVAFAAAPLMCASAEVFSPLSWHSIQPQLMWRVEMCFLRDDTHSYTYICFSFFWCWHKIINIFFQTYSNNSYTARAVYSICNNVPPRWNYSLATAYKQKIAPHHHNKYIHTFANFKNMFSGCRADRRKNFFWKFLCLYFYILLHVVRCYDVCVHQASLFY